MRILSHRETRSSNGIGSMAKWERDEIKKKRKISRENKNLDKASKNSQKVGRKVVLRKFSTIAKAIDGSLGGI